MSQFGESVPRDIAHAERGPALASQSDSNPSDGSEALFCMYLDRAIEEDKKMVEGWKSNTDGILVFTGLFSAVVAAFLAVSVQIIQRSPQDTSSFYLAHIYQQLSTQSNGSQPSIPSSLTNPIDPFSPPTSGVWVNGLWFLSLVISLTCALLALFLQQWARRYLRVAYPHYGPHKRARIRAFYKDGVEKLHIPLAIEVIPVLLHIALFLFFAGLSVYLFGVHHTIFKVVTAWIGACVVLYAYLTILPILHKNNPCASPLSSAFSFFLTGIRYIFFRLLRQFPHIDAAICMPLRGRDPRVVHLGDFFSPSMTKTAEKYALELDPGIDYSSLLWTFQSLDEDADLEKFFVGLPRLCDSDTGMSLKLQKGFIGPNKTTLSSALIEMMNRTLSSDLAPEIVKQRRLIICTKALESMSLFGPWWILRRVLLGGWHRFLGCIEFGLFLQNWKDIAHPISLFYRQCVAALTISIVRNYDERWYQLASGLLEVSKTLLDKYIRNDDSILLANAIFIVRRTVQTYSGAAERHRNDIIIASSKTLETVCKLDTRRTLPELQHEFCSVWNQLVAKAQSDPPPHHGFVATTTLKNIRKLFIALHEYSGTLSTAFYTTNDDRDPILDDPKSYPMCTNDNHIPSDSIPDLQFDEPDTGDGPPAPFMTPMLSLPYPYPLIQPLSFPTPFSPSTPYQSLSIPFPRPQITRPNFLDVQPGVNVRSPPSPPRLSTSSPHHCPIESDYTLGGSTAPQQAEEAKLVVDSPSSKDYTLHRHTQEFAPPSPATNFVHNAQVTSIANSSDPESIGLVITRDVSPLVLVPHDPGQPAPSTAVVDTKIFVRPDDPTSEIHASDSGETSQTLAPPLILQRPDPVPATIAPFTGPNQPSYSVPDPGDITNAVQDTTSSATPNHSLETNRRTASIPLVPTGFSVPVFTPFHVASSSKADPSQSGIIPFYPTGDITMPRLRARGLVNRENMCFANAILQLLVHCPSFWNIFRELDELMGKYGAEKSEKSDAGMTPLVDATLRFLSEFVYEENSQSQTSQPRQQSTRGNPSDDEGKEEQDVDSFEPTYMYNVMKGKPRLKKLLDSQQQDAEEFFDAYLEALDEEMLLLLDSVSTHKSPKVEEHEVSQSGKGQTDLGMRDHKADSVESPITRKFSLKLRSTAGTTDQPISDSVEDWRSLRLDILDNSVCTIADALVRFLQLQSGPSCSGEASDKVLIESLPPVLVLYLNRSADHTIVKVAKSIPFSPLLDIPPEIMAPTARPLYGPTRYKLSGVLYHHGDFTGNGHYTVDVLDSKTEDGSRDIWLHIDDETVNKVHLEDEFPEHHKARARDQCSAMLFYHRTTS